MPKTDNTVPVDPAPSGTRLIILVDPVTGKRYRQTVSDVGSIIFDGDDLRLNFQQASTFAGIKIPASGLQLVYVAADETQNGLATLYLYNGPTKILQILTQ